MFTATWLLGMCAAIAALAICRAEAQLGHANAASFDKPLRRACSKGLAWASLGLLMFYGMLGDGIIIPAVAAVTFGGAGLAAVRYINAPLSHFGGAAVVLALFGFAYVIAAFQQVYGDYFFGFDDPFAH